VGDALGVQGLQRRRDLLQNGPGERRRLRPTALPLDQVVQ